MDEYIKWKIEPPSDLKQFIDKTKGYNGSSVPFVLCKKCDTHYLPSKIAYQTPEMICKRCYLAEKLTYNV